MNYKWTTIFPSSFSLLSPEMRENSEISYFILNTICQGVGGECVWLRIIGLWETSRYLSQRTGNSLTCNPRHTFSFHAHSRLTIHWLTGSLWASSPFGRVARSHSRAAREIWRELRRSLSCSLVACFARHLKWRACSQANLWGFLKTS